jgi:hypothetical protein
MSEPPNDARPDAARSARLRDALRENLKRRKSQARGRAAAPTDSVTGDPQPADAGVAEDRSTPKR